MYNDHSRFCQFQITLPYDAQQLSKTTRNTAAIYLACGVDPSKVLTAVCTSVYATYLKLFLSVTSTCCFYICRLLCLYSLMFVPMWNWCGYWVPKPESADWAEWSNLKRNLARRCVATVWGLHLCLNFFLSFVFFFKAFLHPRSSFLTKIEFCVVFRTITPIINCSWIFSLSI